MSPKKNKPQLKKKKNTALPLLNESSYNVLYNPLCWSLFLIKLQVLEIFSN